MRGVEFFFFVWLLMLWSGERKGGMEVGGGGIIKEVDFGIEIIKID